MNKPYLFGLDSLRFIAAFLVVIYHCNDALRQVDPQLFSDKIFLSKGHFAVDYFFVISGFLLTFLSLYEYSNNHKLNLRNFYVRRILRIFPLYYLSVFLGLSLIGVIYPIVYKDNFLSFNLMEGLLYYVFFLPNLVIVKWQNIGPTYSLWSIGVEEQFYLFFPWMMLMIYKIRNRFYTLAGMTLSYLIFYMLVYYEVLFLGDTLSVLIVKTLKFHFLLFGCVMGYLYYEYKDRDLLNWLNSKALKIIAIIGFVFSISFLSRNVDPHNIIGVLTFTLLLMSLLKHDSQIHIDWKGMAYLGTISYGIYIYHPFVSIGVRFIMQRINDLNQAILSTPWLFYVIVLVITIIIAHLSYKYFEMYFLNKKKSYYS